MRKVCPECSGNLFHDDSIHDETICRQCGLVITGPPVQGIIYPYYRNVPQSNKWIVNNKVTHHTVRVVYKLGGII